jgi:hypothetical protein
MAYSIMDIVLEAFSMEDFTFTYFITGNPSPTDIVGKAVSLDTTTRGAVKLAADGDLIVGRIYQYEDRTQQGGGKVVSVERKFRKRLPKTAPAIAIGDMVEGAGNGLVKTLAAPTIADMREPNTVIDVNQTDGYVIVEKF